MGDPSKTPAFLNKGVVNYYEGASDDLSMLKEIQSNETLKNVNLT
jgi:hypothetical protein